MGSGVRGCVQIPMPSEHTGGLGQVSHHQPNRVSFPFWYKRIDNTYLVCMALSLSRKNEYVEKLPNTKLDIWKTQYRKLVKYIGM